MRDKDVTDVRETTPIGDRSPEETPTIISAPADARGAEALAPGDLVAGRYRVVALIGRGGMGAVYRADDIILGQAVALKFISGRASPRAIERLTDEVRIGRRITHPNVCRLHDIVEAEGRRFLVMEFVDGEDLASLLDRLGALPHDTAETIAHDIAAGLAAAHAEGIVHRDLKPGNVMIDGRGRARITDFGLAIAAADTAAKGEVAGTPAYMAPEQLRGDPVDARADLYALGLILCELFTGQRLNEERRLTEIAEAPAKVPASLTAWAPQIDPAVERFILRALDPEPAKRPASARELLTLLPMADPLRAAIAAGETPTPEMVAAAAKTGTMSRAAIAGIVIAIIAGLLVEAAVAQRSRLYALARLDPDTLEARAKQVARRIAPELRAADDAWWFEADRDIIRSTAFRTARTWDAIAALDPGLVRFVYRQSDVSIVAGNASETVSNLYILQSGRITLQDPPIAPGMATVILDRNGQIIRAEAVTADGEMRAEPSGLRSAPWKRKSSALLRISEAAQLAIMFGSFGVAIVFALRNRRNGRGDARGATRLSIYAFTSLVLAWLVGCDHVIELGDEARLFSVAFGAAAAAAVTLWFFYLALEPFVRRRFPQALVSWSRLLNGRLADSLVARDLLIGIGGGVAGCLILDAAYALPALWGGRARVVTSLQAIGPFHRTLGNAFVLQVDSIETAIGMIFALVFLQQLVKRTAIAVAAWFAIFLLASLTLPALAPYLALMLVLLLRFGLLTVTATNLVAGTLRQTSLTLDPTAWFFGRSTAVLSVIAAAVLVLAFLTTRAMPTPVSASRGAAE